MASETLGERIKRLRVERNLTAAQVGQRAGVGENAIYKIERGDTKQPEFVTAIKIAHALGVSPTYLAGLRDGGSQGLYQTTTDSSPTEPLAKDEPMVVSDTQQEMKPPAEVLERIAALEEGLAAVNTLLVKLASAQPDAKTQPQQKPQKPQST